MIQIPLSVFFMTSTKGHYGHDTYLATLDHFNRQIPWSDIQYKLAHIKVTPGEEKKAEVMEAEFWIRGFEVLKTTAEWARGTSHQVAYNQDLVKVSKHNPLYRNQYVLWLEDDSTLTINSNIGLTHTLGRMIAHLDMYPEKVSFRFIRRGDFDGGVPKLCEEFDYFVSPNFDFQPLILRSRDFFLAAKVIEENAEAQKAIQIEMLWRMVLDQFSRSEHKHMVWLPSYAETIHLGVPNYLEIKASLHL